jgi:hypothetical protein
VTNPSKQKGTRFETEIADYLGVERRTLGGSKDKGDLAISGWVAELKNEKSIDLAGYMTELEVERQNAKVPFGVAIVKRKGKGPAESYAVMPLRLFRMLAWPHGLGLD